MASKHAIIYVPGLGDHNLGGQKLALRLWRFRNVRIEICAMGWNKAGTWTNKLNHLLRRIDELHRAGNKVSLIGISAGATAVLQALQQRPQQIHSVVIVSGKSQHPEKVAAWRYEKNPALKDALHGSVAAIKKLKQGDKAKILNLHPLFDNLVPVKETKIKGVKDSYMPIVGHVLSISLAITLWSFRIVHFVRHRR